MDLLVQTRGVNLKYCMLCTLPLNLNKCLAEASYGDANLKSMQRSMRIHYSICSTRGAIILCR